MSSFPTFDTAHTPGPWTVLKGHVVGVDLGPFNSVSVADCKSGYGSEETNAANARLIAAAPELLAACEEAIHALNGREHDGFLRKAIAKAKGTTV